MASISKPKLLQTLALISLLLMLANKGHSQGDYTTFSYNFFNPKSKSLIYQGDAHVLPGNTFLRLTKTDAFSCNPASNSVGGVWYSKPVKFWERRPPREAAFETIMKYNITPLVNFPPYSLFFFIGPFVSYPPAFPNDDSIGGTNSSSSSIFAVVSSDRDPNHRYIRININSRRFMLGQMVCARLKYEPDTRTMSINVTSGAHTHTGSSAFDFQRLIPQQAHVGIQASTANEVAVHDLHSWYFSSTLVDAKLNSEEDKTVNQKKSENEDTYIKQYV